jgi:hypothetical protein
MPKCAAFMIALLLSFQLPAQKIEKELVDQDWRLISGLSNKNLLLSSGTVRFAGPGTEYSESRVRVSPTEAVVLSHINKEEFAVKKINNKLQVVWSTPLTAIPLFVGQVNGNILVISAPTRRGVDWKNEFDGMLLDAKSGKLLLKKNLYTGAEDFVFEPKLLIPSATGDFYFGVRETAYKKGLRVFPYGIGYSKSLEKYNVSSAFSFFTVNDKLEITNRAKLPVNETDEFIDCGITTSKHLIVASAEGSNIKLEKFDLSTGKSAGRFAASIDARNRSEYQTNLFVSRVDPDKAYLAVEYTNSEKDKTLALVQFNFATKKIIRDEQAYDKSYMKSYKQEYTLSIKDAEKPEFDKLEYLAFTNLAEYNDKLIVFKEIKYQVHNGGTGSSSATRYYCKDGMLTVYDDKLKIVSQQLIPKTVVGFFDLGRSSSMQVKDDKVHIVSGLMHNSLKFGTLYTMYDLKNARVEKYEKLSKQQIANGHPAEASATLWFDDGFIVNYLEQESIFKVRFTSNLQKVSY